MHRIRRVLTAAALAMTCLTVAGTTTPVAAADPPTCDGRIATIVVVTPLQTTAGTAGDDVIVGTDAADVIDGAGGNDVICAGAGADRIFGGEGNDRLFGQDDHQPATILTKAGDRIMPGPGDDYVDLGLPKSSSSGYRNDPDLFDPDRVSYADATGPVHIDLEAWTITGWGTDTLAAVPRGARVGAVGTDFDDTIAGGLANDVLDGGGGDDLITGGDGRDVIFPDRTVDMAFGAVTSIVGGDDVVNGGPAADDIHGGYGSDDLSGDKGFDSLSAPSSERSILSGGPNGDRLTLSSGVRGIGGPRGDLFSVSIKPNGRLFPGQSADGGPGLDGIDFRFPDTSRVSYALTMDVPRRRVLDRRREVVELRSLEDFYVTGPRIDGSVRFRGGPANEIVSISAKLRARADLRGGAGNDELSGGHEADFLDGGPGRDRLYGGRERDRCVRGEWTWRCEIQR